jgi:hypothetical protein
MKFYLAASYDRMDEMALHRLFIESRGHKVTSRWIDGHPEIIGPDGLTVQMINDPQYFALCRETADHDLLDIEAADAVLSFSGATTSGARHVEVGYALALGLPIYVIGDFENLFHTAGMTMKCGSVRDAVKSAELDYSITVNIYG